MFNWFAFLSYAVVTAVTPGPNNILSMTNASRRGFRGALPFNLGVWAGFSIVMAACTLLCGLLSALIPRIKLPMLILGAAYMLYLAWRTLRSGGPEEAAHPREGFLSGFALQFINPKIYIYCILSMEAYILPHFGGNWPALMGFALLLAFIGFLFTLCWSAFGSLLKRLFAAHGRVINALLALLLVYCAVSLFLS